MDTVPESEGGSGGSFTLPGKGLKDARLERLALKRRWRVPREKRKAMIDRQIEIAIGKDGSGKEYPARESTQAFKAVLEAEKNDDDRTNGSPSPATSLNLNIGVQVVPQVLRDEPEYVEYLRRRALEADSQSSALRANGQPGAMENGTSPNGHRPGTDQGSD